MVQRMACQLPERFAAMASLGSSMDTLLYQNCSPSKPIPMAFFNGTADPAMPFYGGAMENPLVTPVMPVDSTVQFWVNHNHCQTVNPAVYFPDIFTSDSSTAELYSFAECDCDAEVFFYKLVNGGHTWPGVYVASQASVLGNTNLDINASIELWEFFNAHSLCDISVGFDREKSRQEIKLYPNPASSEIRLNLLPTNNYNIVIYNSVGQVMIQAHNQQQIDVSGLSGGIYLVKISYEEGTHNLMFIKN